MEELKPTLCFICFDVTSVENSRIVEETVKVVLDVLLLKLPVDVSASVICNACYTKVFEAYQFKTGCIHTEDIIFPYVNSSNGVPIDLKEVYRKKRGKEQFRSVSEDEKTCRLCMEMVTSGFTSVGDLESDLISKYIPEVNFDSTLDPIVCTACVASLKRHSSFLRNCLGVQKFENEAVEAEFHIKTEEIEIKSEEDNQDTETLLPPDEQAVCISENKDGLETYLFKTGEYKCNRCAYRSTKKHNLRSHELKHKKLSEVRTYKCDACNFITKHKNTLVTHQLMHKNESEVQKYKCHACNFESKYKSNLVRHELVHKDTSEVEMYKCDSCNYETKFRNRVVKHRLIHLDVSEVQMYKCDACNYESKRKENLNLHRRIHKDSSQVQMYKCDACSYCTRHKTSLTRHSLTHTDVSAVQNTSVMYAIVQLNTGVILQGDM